MEEKAQRKRETGSEWTNLRLQRLARVVVDRLDVSVTCGHQRTRLGEIYTLVPKSRRKARRTANASHDKGGREW